MPDTFPEVVANRTMDLLRQKRALLRATGTVFWVRPLRDRVVVIFDPAEVVLSRVDEDFAHELSTLLHGRRVVHTNSRGLFLQIGYTIPPRVELRAAPLDLAGRAMMGDAGANSLGIAAGIALAVSLPWWGKLAATGVLLGIHLYSERRSLSDLIARAPALRWLDRLGRAAEDAP